MEKRATEKCSREGQGQDVLMVMVKQACLSDVSLMALISGLVNLTNPSKKYINLAYSLSNAVDLCKTP